MEQGVRSQTISSTVQTTKSLQGLSGMEYYNIIKANSPCFMKVKSAATGGAHNAAVVRTFHLQLLLLPQLQFH